MDTAKFDMEKLYPAPWPGEVKTIPLQTLSMAKLLSANVDECKRMFDVCTREGFFYLNVLDHPKGKKMWEDACVACQVGHETLPQRSVEEKRLYKVRDRIGVFDRGYNCRYVAEDGRPRYSEACNIPQTELFSSEPTDFKLPPWLAAYEENFKAAMTSGNLVANVILGVLERELKLPTGSFTSLHRLTDPSSDFLRILRYPGSKPETVDHLSFPAHKDAVSVALLFTWLGGLQIPRQGAKVIGTNQVVEEDWRWVKPVPGTAIVNLGDAMEIFTNGVLKSGLHRVIKAPGSQAPFDKYSVLIAARPSDRALMKAFKSSMIPADTPEQAKAAVLTSEEWGTAKVKGVQELLKKREGAGEVLSVTQKIGG